MRVLAIETSCDETAAAVVDAGIVEVSQVASQFELHAAFGGVVPEIASRRHMEVIDEVVGHAMSAAPPPYDAIAVTQGPGLVGALLVGLGFSKGLAAGLGLPVIPVDHLFGHVASVLIDRPDLATTPFMCLLASGGHTLLLDVEAGLSLRLLGRSRDDAAGEAFDKGARLLGLSQPGGPSIEQAAAAAPLDEHADLDISPAMIHDPSCDMSFSGIKTALALHKRSASSAATTAPLAAAYQHAIVETLAAAVTKGLTRTRRRVLAVVGGVAANQVLRDRLTGICREYDAEFVAPELRWCSDNAAMIGIAAPFCAKVPRAEADLLDAYPASALSRTGLLAPTASG